MNYIALIFSLTSSSWQQYETSRNQVLSHQAQLLQSLSSVDTELIVSIKYILDLNQSSKPKSVIFISCDSEFEEQVTRFFTKSFLSDFYTFQNVKDESLAQLDWVQSIGQVVKYEEFPQDTNYYLPYPLEPIADNDMQAVWNALGRLEHNLILEITLKVIPNHSRTWINAINEMSTQLESTKGSNLQNSSLHNNAVDLYRKYQNFYLHGNLFEFNIKALGGDRSDVDFILKTLVSHATKPTHHGKQCPILIYSKGDYKFEKCLQAAKNLNLVHFSDWEDRHYDLGQKLIEDAYKPKKELSLLDKFDDGSLNIFGNAPASASNVNQTNQGDLMRSTGSFLSRPTSQPSPKKHKISDLHPLSYLATAQEISSLFRIPIPTLAEVNFKEPIVSKLPEYFDVTYVVQNYDDLITEDSYIVGIDETGIAHASYWSKIPHRIVAGVTGTGKTNFIKSVIYQFLHVNSKLNIDRKIWIADFQKGMHYQLIVDLHPTLTMVTELEDFAELLKTLWDEHEDRREIMRQNRVTSLERLEKKCGIKKHRMVLIIDEAFFILNAPRLTRVEIDKHLMGLAAQSRVTGIHILYCSQRPTPEVIPRQISDNMDERVIFNVGSAASVMLLENDSASTLPRSPKGRAIYRGVDESKLIATPYVPDEVWE